MSKDSTPFVIDETPRFIAIPYEFVDHMADLGGAAVMIYLALKHLAGSQGSCFPSNAYLQRITGLSYPTVRSAIDRLIELGMLEAVTRTRTNGSQTTNQYILRNYQGGYKNLIGGGGKESYTPRTIRNVEQVTLSNDNVATSKKDESPPVHALLEWWCEKYQVEKLASFGKEATIAKRLLTAGLKLDEADRLHDYIATDGYWQDMDAIPLAVMLSQYNRWRAAGSPATRKRHIPDV